MTTTTACDWEKRWQIADTLWDKGRASPALVSFLKDHGDLIPSQGIGLVPGCGAGYDVLLLSTPDRHMTGLDMSPTCIAKVKKDYPEGNYDFICDDFYKFQIPQRGYDLVYDYTFLCAMPPVMRPQWSSRMAEIIRPGGVLIALMYPLEEREGGPPFGLSEEVYMELLGDNFENIYLADARGHPNRIGREKMSVWKRK
ncbi:S-adenosyl-L-methionine-dependent methyltransferase [Dichotomocladium elegans]|nr:S-adenosyl-L-methionine-dependent methyltransferase [Dichotomocladium elegans]